MIRGISHSLLLVILLIGMSSCVNSTNNESRTIILAHAMHPSHPVSVAMQKMADDVAELSEGALEIKIYTGAQLGSEREMLELIQIGTIGMTKVSAATMENIVPAMQVLSLPYLFRDSDHVLEVLDGSIGNELLETGIPYRLRGLAYYDAGSRSIYTVNRRVEHPDDLRGQKIRVMESGIAMNLMSTMGGSPTPISFGELYTAFQGGVVDGAENNPPSFYTSRHYEVVQYYVLNEHATIPDLLIIGSRLWDNLSEQEQQWLQTSIDESVAYQRELWKTSTKESLQRIEESGVEIIYPDKEPFRQAMQPMYERIRTQNPELYEWFSRIQSVGLEELP